MTDVRDHIRKAAQALGFDACRFASAAAPWTAGGRLHAFVEAGRHGDMGWMETTRERRVHPTAMWDGARSAVVLGLNYGPGEDPLPQLADRSAGYLSVYARGDDYHELIKGRLKTLAGQIAARTGQDVKVFVDTAPLMEKPLAQRSGLGWQGKHTNLLSREHGNWLFLGVILSAAELTPDDPETEHCGSCRACLDACPTDAFPAPFQLDARRCLSYLTIEFAGPWPVAFRTATGVHAAAIIKALQKGDTWLADRVYSGVPAGQFGRKQEIIIGFMSGASNVAFWLRERSIEPDDALVAEILKAAKATDHILEEPEVLAIVKRVRG